VGHDEIYVSCPHVGPLLRAYLNNKNTNKCDSLSINPNKDPCHLSTTHIHEHFVFSIVFCIHWKAWACLTIKPGWFWSGDSLKKIAHGSVMEMEKVQMIPIMIRQLRDEI
jgi:hypothetical protein